MSADDLKFLSDPDPHVRDAAWWKIQFDWRHERLEEEERERMRYKPNELSYSWVYRDLPKESGSWWGPLAIGVIIGLLILALFGGVLAVNNVVPAPVSNQSSCVDRVG